MKNINIKHYMHGGRGGGKSYVVDKSLITFFKKQMRY